MEGQQDGQGLEHSSCNKLGLFRLEKIWLQVDLKQPPSTYEEVISWMEQ